MNFDNLAPVASLHNKNVLELGDVSPGFNNYFSSIEYNSAVYGEDYDNAIGEEVRKAYMIANFNFAKRERLAEHHHNNVNIKSFDPPVFSSNVELDDNTIGYLEAISGFKYQP